MRKNGKLNGTCRPQAHALANTSNGKMAPLEYRIVRRDGNIVTVFAEAIIIDNDEGKPVRLMGMLQDITERKLMEAQILQAVKMQAVGTLAGGIAHNFNNLLQIISGGIGLLGADINANHPDFELIAAINRSITRGSNLTGQLIGFAKGGKYLVKSINLNETLDRISALILESYQKVRTLHHYEEHPWNIQADQNQIEQVLLNIIVNGLQAMPDGGQLTLGTENVALDAGFADSHQLAAGHYIKVSITDTGTGMDQETRARLFEPFFTTRDLAQSSGLGLASAFGIIRNHQGIITVESEIGEGTRFDLYLPAADKEIVESREPPKPDARRGTGTILYVDDEEDVAAIGQRLLEVLGYKVLTATSGQQALELYERSRGKIDLVILDMIMPGMGGSALFDRLKELNPKVKVLLSSGYSFEGAAGEIMKRGCGGFVQKPFDLETLSGQIQKILNPG